MATCSRHLGKYRQELTDSAADPARKNIEGQKSANVLISKMN